MVGKDVKVEFSMDGGESWSTLGTLDLSTIEDLGPVPPTVRLYNVIWVRSNGIREQVNLGPLPHMEANWLLSRFTKIYRSGRVFLEEIKP